MQGCCIGIVPRSTYPLTVVVIDADAFIGFNAAFRDVLRH